MTRARHRFCRCAEGSCCRLGWTDLPKGAAAFILLRPEKLRLSQPEQGRAGASAEVLDTVYVGDITRVTLRMQDGATLVAKETNRADSLHLSPGAQVRVAWAREDATLYTRRTFLTEEVLS